MAKILTEKRFDRLASGLAQLDADQLGRLLAEVMRRQLAAAACATVTEFAVKQAADLVGVSDETIRRWCSVYKIGRQFSGIWIVSAQRLLAFLESDNGARVVKTTPKMPDAPNDLRRAGS
jgi:hypothetical protein